MVSAYIAWYLFLAGMGGGAFLIGSVAGFWTGSGKDDRRTHSSAFAARGLVFGPLAVAVGVGFLLADLGSPGRAVQIFFSPPRGILAWGSWAIAAFLASSGLDAALRIVGRSDVARRAGMVVRVSATVLSLVVIAYSGVYLSLFPTVPFLHSPLVPALFVLSALATGLGALMVLELILGDGNMGDGRWKDAWMRAERVVAVLEAVVLAVHMVTSWFAGEMHRTSVESLIAGDQAVLFWLGVVAVGLCVPIVSGLCERCRHGIPMYALGGVCAVAGGLSLRYALLLVAVRYSSFGWDAVIFWD